MMRLDSEITTDLTEELEANINWQKVEEYITTQNWKAIILEDYNKGVLTKK